MPHQLGLQDLDDQVAGSSIAAAAVASIDILEILPQDSSVGPGGIVLLGLGSGFDVSVTARVCIDGIGKIPAPAPTASPPALAAAQTPASSPEDAGVAASAIIIVVVVVVLRRMVEEVALAPQYLDGPCMHMIVFVLGSSSSGSSCFVAAATVVVARTVVSLSKDGPDSVRNARGQTPAPRAIVGAIAIPGAGLAASWRVVVDILVCSGMGALAPAWRQSPASIAPIGGVVVAAVPLAEPPPQARGSWSGTGGRSVAGAVIVIAIVIETCAPVAHAHAFIETRAPLALALASVGPIQKFAGEPAAASAAGGRRRSWFLLVKVFLQDKDGRKTPLPEAGAQQEFRCRDDFGGRRYFHLFVLLLPLLLPLMVVYYLLLLVVLGGIRILLLQLQLLKFLLQLF